MNLAIARALLAVGKLTPIEIIDFLREWSDYLAEDDKILSDAIGECSDIIKASLS